MGNIFLKRRSLYMFYYWCNRTLPEAEFRYQMADAALKNNVIADEDLTKIEKEKNDAFKELLAYKSFLAELTDVEKEIERLYVKIHKKRCGYHQIYYQLKKNGWVIGKIKCFKSCVRRVLVRRK